MLFRKQVGDPDLKKAGEGHKAVDTDAGGLFFDPFDVPRRNDIPPLPQLPGQGGAGRSRGLPVTPDIGAGRI